MAQRIEHWSSEPTVGGSNPSGRKNVMEPALCWLRLFATKMQAPNPHPWKCESIIVEQHWRT